MKILVVGAGGREHALVWKLSQNSRVDEIYCAPGNGGIKNMATCIDIAATDFKKLADFAQKQQVNLTVVGPEVALTLGIIDYFENKGLRIFGPSRQASVMEGSKIFMKDLLKQYKIPSGYYEVFTDREQAVQYIKKQTAPMVVKADGLAAGKGVIVAHSQEEAVEAVDLIMLTKAFGAAGEKIIIEEFLNGEEASFLAFTDGKTVLPLPSSQDHKAVYDGDKGPNTGGMGAYSPAPVVTDAVSQQVMSQIMLPVVQAMAAEGRPYKGVLYAGLMIENGTARVLEFNCRFGDPETQPLLMRLKSDLVDIMEAVIDQRLDEIKLDIDPRPAVCVVMAAGGYPGKYLKGQVITGLDDLEQKEDVVVFHAGTAVKKQRPEDRIQISGTLLDKKRDFQIEQIVTAGGRVLGVTATGDTLPAAIKNAYDTVTRINWQDCYYRKDIAAKALTR